MGYRIVELQTDSNGATAILPNAFDYMTREEAESEWHHICQYAAISSVAVHSVVILNAEGEKIRKDTYKHKSSQPEPEPEPENEGGNE